MDVKLSAHDLLYRSIWTSWIDVTKHAAGPKVRSSGRKALAIAAIMGLSLPGCAGMFTRSSIEKFSVGLEAQDLEQLKLTASAQFEQKALRLPESAKDLKILRLPTGKISVESEEKIDDTHKKVVVLVGEKDKAREVVYLMSREDQFKRWEVDDIEISQKDPDGKTISRTVTDQMDLLLTCREFLGAWREGSREQKLAFCTGEVHDELSALPAAWLEQLTSELVGDGRERAFRPEARMNGDRAALGLDHPDGTMTITFEQQPEGAWLVSDVALMPASRSDAKKTVVSARKVANSLNKSASFLKAYGEQDRKLLESLCAQNFFKMCLKEGDLSKIPLPVTDLLATEYEVRQYPDHHEVLLETGSGTYMVTLTAISETHGTQLTIGEELFVNEVTQFTGDNEAKRLSAMYLAQDVVNLFVESLGSGPNRRDLSRLREISSVDFTRRVWNHPSSHLLKIVSLPEVEGGPATIVSTVFRGDHTEVTATQGKKVLTFVLVQNDSWMTVDDVLISEFNRPASLKENLELLLPVYTLASAAHTGNLDGFIAASAQSLDQMIWEQIDQAPGSSPQIAASLVLPVSAVQRGDMYSVVRTGNKDAGAEVHLVEEAGRYVVHSIALLQGSQPEGRVEILQELRSQIAAGQLMPRRFRRDSQVIHAGNVESQSTGGVGSALYETQQHETQQPYDTQQPQSQTPW